MTLYNLFRTTFIYCLILFLFSCNQIKTSDSEETAIKFDSIVISKQKFLFNDTSKSRAQIELQLLTPKTSTPQNIKSLVENSFKYSLFGKNESNSSIEMMAKNFVANYLKEYKQLEAIYLKNNKEASEKNTNNDSEENILSAYNYKHNTSIKIVLNNNSLLSYIIERFNFSGGAHGVSTDSCFTILIHEGRFLKEEDLFDEKDYENIAQLIVQHIAKDNKVEDPIKLEELGFFSIKEIAPNGNMLATKEGITWIYNPYDIAAYAIGSIKVTISYTELKPYLKPKNPLSTIFKQ